MTSVFDTRPPLIYVLFSYVREIRFWNQYPPTFYANVLLIRSLLFSDGFPNMIIIIDFISR